MLKAGPLVFFRCQAIESLHGGRKSKQLHRRSNEGCVKLRSMRLGFSGVVIAGLSGLIGATLGCSSTERADFASAGAAGVSGVNGAGAGNLAGASGSSGAMFNGCPEHPTPQRTQGSLLSMPLHVFLQNQAFAFGQRNALSDGGSVVPLNFRFYISEVALQRKTGESVTVDVLTAAGAPAPYGVHLFDAEEPNSSTLRVLAPAGDYAGLSFALGIELACNQLRPDRTAPPLTTDSQMTWPHSGGFLFLRYEGRNEGADGSADAGVAATIPSMVHMGGSIAQELVPRVTVAGAFSLSSNSPREKALNVIMDDLFAAATSNLDVSDMSLAPGAEAIAGERLRRSISGLSVFQLEPG